MIIYSVTVTIDAAIRDDWTEWMRTVHIPDVMKTGYFKEAHMQYLLEPMPEPGLVTYNIQYTAESASQYDAYQRLAAPALQKDHSERYKDHFVAFRTILKREESF